MDIFVFAPFPKTHVFTLNLPHIIATGVKCLYRMPEASFLLSHDISMDFSVPRKKLSTSGTQLSGTCKSALVWLQALGS
jgi:hypothetical protein